MASSSMEEPGVGAGAGTGGPPLSRPRAGEAASSGRDHAGLAAGAGVGGDPLSGAAAGDAGAEGGRGGELAGAGAWAGGAGGSAGGVELGEGTAELGGADAPAEAALADALQRWRMSDDDDGRGRITWGSQGPSAPAHVGPADSLRPAGRGALPEPGAGQRGSPDAGLRPGGRRVPTEPRGVEPAGAGGGRQADSPTAVQLFAGFVSYEMLDAVVVGAPGGRTRRDASASGTQWVKMKGPGAHAPSLLTRVLLYGKAGVRTQRGRTLLESVSMTWEEGMALP